MTQLPGGFLGGANMFRSLTLSPLNSALQQAHQMARRHLEVGGAATSATNSAAKNADSQFVLPEGVDPFQVALAIASRLHGSRAPIAGLGNEGLMALAKKPNGAVVVLPEYVHRLGGGNASRGRQVLEQIVAGIREEHRRDSSTHQPSTGV